MPQFDLISKATKMRKIKDIALFSMIDESCVATVQALFESREYKKGTCILEYDRPVDGLYLLERGEVGVTIPELEGELATLGEGSSFGELTLFNAIDRASATVKVSSDVAQVEFCPRQALMEALKVHPLLAAGFYHGSALLISARLRTTNEKISGEIAKSIKMAKTLLVEVSASGHLGHAQQELHDAGTHIVSTMTGIVKSLLVMKQSGEQIDHEDISHLADSAKEIYYSDFHVFGNVHKQLQILGQHLDNVMRLLSQQEIVEVEDDLSLLDIS